VDEDLYEELFDDSTYEGTICSFDPSLWTRPLQLVNAELSEFRRSLASIAPKDMETLIGQLLAQYMQCEVRHVGRAGDDGIDLIVIRGDSPMAVQIKHRVPGRRAKSESVVPVREFVGAILAEGFSSGLFVTTDETFSSAAKTLADKVRRRLIPLNLITVHDLRAFMGQIHLEAWQEYRVYGVIRPLHSTYYQRRASDRAVDVRCVLVVVVPVVDWRGLTGACVWIH